MAENDNSLPVNASEEIRLITPTDSKQWDIVQRVLAEFNKDCTTTVDACKAAGINRSTYYIALQNPIVQQLRLEQMQGTAAAAQHMVEKNWMPMLANMIRIARGDSREAVPAARFVKDVYEDIQRGLGPTQEAGEESDAAKAIRSFLGGKKVLLRQTVTTREIEVNEGISEGSDVIEGEVVHTDI